MLRDNSEMRLEYDFSKGIRGNSIGNPRNLLVPGKDSKGQKVLADG
jgi:hypothetical protein